MSLKIFYKIAKDTALSGKSIEIEYFDKDKKVSEEIYSFSSEENLSSAVLKLINEILSLNKSFVHYYYDKKNSYIELEDLMNQKKVLVSETNKNNYSSLDKAPSIKEFML